MICATRDNGAAARRRYVAGRSRRRWRLRAGVALLAVALLTPAVATAADPDVSILRGSYSDWSSTKSYSRWDGWNFGVQLGASNMNTDFGNSSSSLVAFILQNTTIESEFAPSRWTALQPSTTNGRQYGAFIGYSLQWDQLVLGLDVAYNRGSIAETSASDSISRQFVTSDGFDNQVTVAVQSRLKMIDYETIRGRAGYAIDQFLPYAILGAAVGRFNYATTATVTTIGTPPAGGPGVPFNITDTRSNAKDNAIVGGFLGGLGVDVAILPNMFIRAEWEIIAFAPVSGIRTNINTGRVGLGMKF